ncbi:universal stress protein [Nocardia fluminea]|uniref:Nucleotide-binding universal stress UspA family protein n=1 Tax=Nocardia fluminea TaxID=134984 RepID=A0A2N3V4Y1_9NOCA|nr:universal stress protein [Nocardia fluminea]PKV76679.1 nucleotide-binding universal stress UspA family protein [Nocardia fluminea]
MSEPHNPQPGVRDWRDPLCVDGPAGPTAPTTHLVVGFDRHNASHIALDYAIGLARVLNAHLHVAHVIDTDDLPIDPDAADWDHAITEVVERERASACSMLAALPGNWTYHAQRGNPGHLLSSIADAHDASMIVIGAPRHGLASLVERLLGESVSTQLIHHGHRPVLLVPEHSPASARLSRP